MQIQVPTASGTTAVLPAEPNSSNTPCASSMPLVGLHHPCPAWHSCHQSHHCSLLLQVSHPHLSNHSTATLDSDSDSSILSGPFISQIHTASRASVVRKVSPSRDVLPVTCSASLTRNGEQSTYTFSRRVRRVCVILVSFCLPR